MLNTKQLSVQKSFKQSHGFSLVELMVAMFVGFIIITGIFSLHTVTRKTQLSSEVQMDMVADARFAIDMITYDLRHAGMWGGNNRSGLIQCRTNDTVDCTASSDKPTAPTNDCTAGWAYNLDSPVSGVDDSAGANPYSSTCIPASEKFKSGTDILEIKYADSNYIDSITGFEKTLVGGQAYIRSSLSSGRVFVGATQPTIQRSDGVANNYTYNAFAYYISDYTDADGDKIPSLRRAALTNGPAISNQTLISGVVDMQVLYGEDIDEVKDANGNLALDQYVPASAIANPANVFAVKIWLLMRSDQKQKGIDTTKSFSLAGKTAANYGGQDGYRYFMVSSVINLRNAKL